MEINKKNKIKSFLGASAALQTQKKKNILSQRRHMGSLFIIISCSATQPGYLMLGWRVSQHFIFVSAHIPEEYFNIHKTLHTAKVSRSLINK